MISISTLHKQGDNTTILITKACADTILHFDTTVRDIQTVFPTTHSFDFVSLIYSKSLPCCV